MILFALFYLFPLQIQGFFCDINKLANLSPMNCWNFLKKFEWILISFWYLGPQIFWWIAVYFLPKSNQNFKYFNFNINLELLIKVWYYEWFLIFHGFLKELANHNYLFLSKKIRFYWLPVYEWLHRSDLI